MVCYDAWISEVRCMCSSSMCYVRRGCS